MPHARPYHSIVLVKQVPDTRNVTGEVMTKDGTMNRSALPAIFNPEDSNALEMALDFKDRYGGTVTVLSMGPLQAAEVLRDSLCRGADRVILLSDRKFAGADTQATSYTLKCAIDKIGQYDLPEKDYDFWVVAFHNEQDETIYRKDADKSEINQMMKHFIEEMRIKTRLQDFSETLMDIVKFGENSQQQCYHPIG